MLQIRHMPGIGARLVLGLLVLGAGCSKEGRNAPAPDATGPLVKEIAVLPGQGRIEIVAEPSRVTLLNDMVLTIRITSPSNRIVGLPPLSDRCQGFTINGDYERDPHPAADGMIVRERCLKLTPVPGAEYRLAPMAITLGSRDAQTWLATTPVTFDSEPVMTGSGTPRVGSILEPSWIRPGLKGVMWYSLVAVAIAALLFAVWYVSRRIHREIKLRRMSPRERALHELADLVAQDLVGHQRVKDFYFELTMIVRRYIERAHTIRAPEQTTEEFLVAVSRDPQFTPTVVNRLKAFLQAADLVKYAAYRPERPVVDQAYSSARTYIETDAGPGVTVEGETRTG